MFIWMLLLSVLGGSGPALAADAPESASTPAATSMEAPQTRLDVALSTLENGDLNRGCAQLEAIIRESSNPVEAMRARKLAALVNTLDPRSCTFAGSDKDAVRDGSIELIVSQSLVAPAWFIAAGPIWAQIGSPAAVGGLLIAGLAVGMGGSYLAARELRPTEAHAMMVYTGQIVGLWSGIVLEVNVTDGSTPGRITHLAVLGGTGVGIALTSLLPKATAGEVALTRSGLIWGTFFGGMSAGLIGPDEGARTVNILFAGTVVGGGAAIALARTAGLRRGQVNMINLGGYGGAVVGLAAAAITSTGDRSIFALVGGGAAIGLGVSTGLVLSNRSAKNRTLAGLPVPAPTVVFDSERRAHPGLAFSGSF